MKPDQMDGSGQGPTPTASPSENRERVCQQCGGTETKKGPIEYCLDSHCPTKSIQTAAKEADLREAAIAVFDAFHDTTHIGKCSSAWIDTLREKVNALGRIAHG